MAAPTANNFDLIRLGAAIQVALHHTSTHLDAVDHGAWVFGLTRLFPGVPIFFFISGFLISKSFEKNQRLVEYASNRILRIYPALIVCFVVSIVSVYWVGYFDTVEIPISHFLRWVVAQLTAVQFFNPDFMRQYGVGVLNGSLWTISVELQFYVLVPVIYMLSRKVGVARNLSNGLLAILLLIFMVANQVFVISGENIREAFWYKLVGVSFAPWFYMFLFGIFFQRNFDYFHNWLAGKFTVMLLLYLGIAFSSQAAFGWRFGNTLNPIYFVMLSILIFSAAYSYAELSDRILRRNDVSYGVYIYHMPVANFLLAIGFSGAVPALIVAMSATALLAFASWRLVEKPALRFKRHPLYQHYSPAGLATQSRLQNSTKDPKG